MGGYLSVITLFEFFFYLVEYFIHSSVAVHRMIFARSFVVVAQGLCLLVVHVQALLNSVDIVIGTARRFAALKHAFHQLILVDFEAYHLVNLGVIFLEQFVQSMCLRDCAREAVEYHALFDSIGMPFEIVGQDVNHQLVGNELTVRNDCIGHLADVGSFGDVLAQEFARRDVVERVFVDKLLALGAFATAGSTEDYNVHVALVLVFFQDIDVIKVARLAVEVEPVADDKLRGDIESDVVRLDGTGQGVGLEEQGRNFYIGRAFAT